MPDLVRAYGGDLSKVAKHLGRSRRFVQRWNVRSREGKGFGNKRGGGRKRVMSSSASHAAKSIAMGRRKLGSKVIAARLQQVGHTSELVSPSTVRRSLKRGKPEGLSFKVIDKRQRITEAHKQQRVQWARQHKNTNFENWMWTDSKIWRQHKASSRGRWQRKRNQAPQEMEKHPNQAHMYGALTMHGVSRLHAVTGTTGMPKTSRKGVGAEEYCRVIEEIWVPEGNRLFGGREFVVYEDGAPAHRSKMAARTWAKYPHIKVVRAPPVSCDISPLENLWNLVEDKMVGLRFESFQKFMNAVVREWGCVRTDLCQQLCSSVPRRLWKVLSARGGHIERNIYT